MDDALLGWVESVVARRRVCGALWLGALAMGIGGVLQGFPQLVLVAWLVSVVMMVGTAATTRLSKDERLVHARPYRLVAGALLAVTLGGSVLAIAPEASELSRVYAVFFMPVAVLAYRAVIARGPRCGVGTAAIALWWWLPFVVLANFGCRCHRPGYIRVAHWTEIASEAAMPVALFLAAALAAAALFAFRPRTDELPEARVV